MAQLNDIVQALFKEPRRLGGGEAAILGRLEGFLERFVYVFPGVRTALQKELRDQLVSLAAKQLPKRFKDAAKKLGPAAIFEGKPPAGS